MEPHRPTAITAVGMIIGMTASLMFAPAATASHMGLSGTSARQGGESAAHASRGGLRIKVSGQRLGKRATVRIRGISGRADGVRLSVKVGRTKTLRGLPPGRYRIKAEPIRRQDTESSATIRPRRPRVNAGSVAQVRVKYRATTSQSDDVTITEDSRIGQVNLGGSSTDIAMTRDGTTAFVSVPKGFSVVVVKMAGDSPAVLRRIAANSPRGLAVTPDQGTVYFADVDIAGKGVLERRNATNGAAVGAPIPVGSQPQGVVLTPDGSRVYVANSGDRSVSVIDTAAGTVIATIPVSTNPTDLAISADGSRVFVAAADLNVIDTASNTVVKTVTIPNEATGVAAAAAGIYVTSSNRLSIFDPATLDLRRVVGDLGTLANSVTLSPDNARAYVTVGSRGASDSNIQVVDLIERRIMGRIRGVPGAAALGFVADGTVALAAQQQGNTAAVIGLAPVAVRAAGVDVSGAPAVGQTLTALPGIIASVPFPPAVTYQWQSSTGKDSPFTDIAGQNLPEYTVRRADAGRYLRVALTAENADGKQTVFSSPVGIPAPPATTPPTTAPPTGPPASSPPATPPTAPPTSVPPTTPPPSSPAKAANAPRVRVSVKAVSRGNKLRVQIAPALGAARDWSFRVQKRKGSKWVTRNKVYRTKGAAQRVTINLPRGRYRVVVPAAYGYAGATSAKVRLRR